MLKSNRASPKASLGAIALALGGMAVLTAGDGADRVVSQSAKAAKKAAKALEKRDAPAAVAAAEQAVALAPREAGYRMILGQSYLQAGRFQAAAEAFADTLELDRTHGRAALNLALMQTARGDWQAARQTLAANAAIIPGSDLGLALALAGDTAGAVTLLTQIARSPEATPKVRQNLALAYAMGGQWEIARVLAAADMSPAEVDRRLESWAAFVQPKEASDQVASLLGVRPVSDAGQPAALALNAPKPATASAPVAVAQAPVAAPVPIAAAEPAPVPAVAPATADTKPKIVFAAAKEVVQPLPASVIERASGGYKVVIPVPPRRPATKVVLAPKPAPASGTWHVQLGAYDSVAVAKDAWTRATRRYAGFKGQSPLGATFRTANASFYRLSVGGFARTDAERLCREYRVRGGACFVRQSAGDQVAQWAQAKGVQLAMR
jgi:Flp pilus assembly protein TadD